MKGVRVWLRAGTHLVAALPAMWLAGAALGGGLGPDPVGTIIRRTGDVALVLLVLSLLPGAVRRVFGAAALMPARRLLGLYAFGYATLHLVSHIFLGYGGQVGLLLAGLGQNRFALIGLATFVLMLPLAITSSVGWQRRLGHRWRQLHRLAYVAALLDVWHYGWVFKEIRPLPVLALATVVLLLAARIPWAKWLKRVPAPTH
ncbi:MAG: ferric reductase-like transmembrane domain-containing protein [Anaerolineae bacterium]